MLSYLLPFPLLLNLLCGGVVVLGDLTITTPQGLIDFANNVNSGTSYSGTTVYLGADLDFTSALSSSFAPIGNEDKSFKGTFDGQGHTISNLAISSSAENTGLFGGSYGATIKNIVMDSSCSVVCTHSTNLNTDVGGIVGFCYSGTITSNVNMASVTFSGSVSNVKIGGIAARVSYSITIKNCANYGSVTYSEYAGDTSTIQIGGIVGMTVYTNAKYINNCVNYGTVAHKGTTAADLYMGGILGESYFWNTYINNCVSAGNLAKTTSTGVSNYIGTIVGFVSSSSTLNVDHSVWTSDVGYSASYGYKEYGGTLSVSSDSTLITPSATEVSSLNTQASSNSWNGWIFNTNSNTISFKVDNNKDFSFSSKIILLPDLNGTESNSFVGWYTDSAYINSFTSQSVSSATTLYGLYGNIVSVTLNGNGGTPSQQTKYVLPNKAYGAFPTVEREGYAFAGWFTEKDEGKGKVVTKDSIVSASSAHTLYAHWSINNYTLTFIFNNSESNEVRILNYSDTINYPNDPVREGYTFNGWDNKDITIMPAHNLNITAQWVISNYTLTFIFNNGTEPGKRILNYSDPIDYPNDPVKEGYTFSGWNNEDITTMPAHNLIITALWTPNNYTVTFNATGGDISEYEKNVTYDNVYGELPEAKEKEGYSFVGWFIEEDGNGMEITEDTIVAIDDDHTLYAHWTINNYTLTFIFNNSESDEVRILNYSDPIIDYPDNPVREGYTFNGWDNKGITTMPAHNINITALWTINNYTLTFIFNNGKSNEVRILNYNDTIEYPEEVTREGYTFNGWSSKPKTMPARSITITAQWIEKPSEFVEIVFGKKDLSEEEVKAIVSEFTEEEFVIEKFEVDSATGEIRVIIRFVDSSDAAAEFVRSVNENTGSENFIREIGVKENYESLINVLYPMMFFGLLVF